MLGQLVLSAELLEFHKVQAMDCVCLSVFDSGSDFYELEQIQSVEIGEAFLFVSFFERANFLKFSTLLTGFSCSRFDSQSNSELLEPYQDQQ